MIYNYLVKHYFQETISVTFKKEFGICWSQEQFIKLLSYDDIQIIQQIKATSQTFKYIAIL